MKHDILRKKKEILDDFTLL